MKKDEAVKILKDLIARKNKLPIFRLSEDNVEFKKWYKDVEISVRHIFDDKHIEDLYSISLSVNMFSASTPDYIFEDAHNKGVDEIEALLNSFIDEINIFWKIEDSIKNNELDSLRELLNRFHSVARQLRIRYNDRDTLNITDEYDVQDLLHALLRIYFDDIRAEEYTPSYAGGASRIDFLLDDSKIAIEVKKTRPTLKDKKIGEELLIDIQRYKSHPKVKKLICFVYDPESLLINPAGICNDIIDAGVALDTEIIIVPKI